MSHYASAVPVEEVHRWKAEATQRLLGYTIGISEADWHRPSRLPGWTRAHVATHLARNADQLRGIVDAVAAGDPQPPVPDADTRRSELEAGADRSGLELQIDLDTSAGALQESIEASTDWTHPVRLCGTELELSALPLLRLNEVYLHGLDLDCGLTPDGVDQDAAWWLLRWVIDRSQSRDLPPIRIETDAFVAELGSGDSPSRVVTGSPARLWAWLSGRASASVVQGADGLHPRLLT